MASKTRAARSKRTKDELINELEDLEAKLQGQEAPDPTAQAIAKENAAKVRAAASVLSVDNIVSAGATFGLQVQRTVAGLTEQAVQKAEELQTLQEAIEVEKAELERLYALDVVSASTAALIEDHKTKKAALEKEAAVARAAWEEEKLAHTKFVTQRNAELEAARKREQQEYDYRTKQERDRSNEEFNYKLQIAERDFQEKKSRSEKEIAEAMAIITAEQAKLAADKARIEQLDEEIKKKSDAAVAIATNALKKDLTTAFEMQKKDLELTIRLEQQKVISLNEQLERANAEISKLQSQLDAARTEVKEIAAKAVDGASGQTALANLQSFVRDNGASARSGKA